VDVGRRTDLQRLALPRHGPCVSVFLPTHRAGREVEQVPIRLKNLLRQATDVLKTDGVRAPEIDRLLAPLRGLLVDRLFWQYQSDGLALFSRPGWWRSLRVPLHLPELAVVADRFHISPLLPLPTGGGHFFVLALSKNQIRLLEGTRDRLEEVDLPGVPLGVRDALQGEEAQRQLQLSVADRGGVAARGVFHGHGSDADVQKERVLRYFRKVDRALREVLAGERAPMVLAAVEHLAPIWRQANTYPHLVDETLAGSPEGLDPHQLHARAWAVVEPLFLQAQREAAARCERLAGTDLTSQDPREIIRAAEDGRIETLFAARHPASPPGVSSTGSAPSSNGDRALRDVLELAAVTTIIKGGSVYVLPAGVVPGGGSAAAVFRYQAPDLQTIGSVESGRQ
jgi:Bacterial archaeo-eukaryotic release factor family 3